MTTTPAVTAPKPTPPAITEITLEEARRKGILWAKQNEFPSYDAAVVAFKARHGDRALIGFETGYFDGSCGYA